MVMFNEFENDMSKSKVILLVRRLVCENSVLQVYFDNLKTPDSTIPDYMVVEPRA